MKGGAVGGQSNAVPVVKKRWKGLVIAVLSLVLLSMLVPVVFLLGQNNSFQSSSGLASEHQSSSNVARVNGQNEDLLTGEQLEGDKSRHVDDITRSVGPTFPKDFQKNIDKETKNETKGSPLPVGMPKELPKANSIKVGNMDSADKIEAEMSSNMCDLKFGSYCTWHREHTEQVNDFFVRKMKNLLFEARAYYPSIAKLPAFRKLSDDMKKHIQDFEHLLNLATTDNDLPPRIRKKLKGMKAVIASAKACPVDCNNVDIKFRQLVDLTEDEPSFLTRQGALLYQIAVQTMPKSLHCLSMRLTVEYFRSPLPSEKLSLIARHLDPDLKHFVIFSKNVLASSAVINSTVVHAKESENQVFHVLTDRENYFAMKLWFFRNKYKEATVQVLNIEDLHLDDKTKSAPLHLSLPEEYSIFFHNVDKSSMTPMRTEHLSVFSQSHFLLPKIFNSLKKVVVLDDDIIVQRDLSDLWSINLDGKVIGAVQHCSVKLVHLKNFLTDKSFDEKSCAWMSGLNVVDLVRWREQDLSGKFERLVQELGTKEAVTLRAFLLTFQGEVYALDENWVLSGLGYNFSLGTEAVKNARVLHYNGDMKPWLDLAIHDYADFWSNYINTEDQLLSNCNVNY
ncbi:PREDICTED: probable galacturonosyltransferase 7 isoform X2 [Ipomoea nil]|uniref:probable galacturonosyltransferase 7 isoform X2 n=1 Tax=Ipomoea nil TaxID=35883 RepID=UPI000900C046|nr:PREDICTED: probable galacturonosyltransferase 7 isoform X2 [Ipomoea nil]